MLRQQIELLGIVDPSLDDVSTRIHRGVRLTYLDSATGDCWVSIYLYPTDAP